MYFSCYSSINPSSTPRPSAAIVQDLAPPNMRARAASIYILCNTLLGGLGPLAVASLNENMAGAEFLSAGVSDGHCGSDGNRGTDTLTCAADECQGGGAVTTDVIRCAVGSKRCHWR